jgi:lysine-N-methylase
MARRRSELEIVYPEGQRYACRDCPARCCKTWGIPVAPEVAHTILQDEELRKRLVGRAPGVLAGGTLPMVERNGELQCVLLDDDDLCALHKRHGHAALPSACQAYPFGFVKNERQQVVAQLSPHCPSIRDNRGEPVGGLVRAKLKESGAPLTLAPRMGLRSGRTLPTAQYAALVNAWQSFAAEKTPLEAVLASYELTDFFDEALPGKDFDTQEVTRALGTATERQATAPSPPLARRARPTWHARVLYAHLLGGLSAPSRLLAPYAAARPSLGRRLGAWGNQLAWLLSMGSVDLLHVPGRVAVRKIDRVPPFLSGPLGAPVGQYLGRVLEGRQLLTRQTYLTRVLVDLGLGVAVISRFARARAVGHGRPEVERSDVLEGIGIADLLFAHRTDTKNPVIDNLRLTLMSDPAAFRRFLASEA